MCSPLTLVLDWQQGAQSCAKGEELLCLVAEFQEEVKKYQGFWGGDKWVELHSASPGTDLLGRQGGLLRITSPLHPAEHSNLRYRAQWWQVLARCSKCVSSGPSPVPQGIGPGTKIVRVQDTSGWDSLSHGWVWGSPVRIRELDLILLGASPPDTVHAFSF